MSRAVQKVSSRFFPYLMISFVHFISLIYNFLLGGIFSTAFDERRITMAREKEGYRATFGYLAERYPMLISKSQACEILKVSYPHLRKLISANRIKCDKGKIPLGSMASYICG